MQCRAQRTSARTEAPSPNCPTCFAATGAFLVAIPSRVVPVLKAARRLSLHCVAAIIVLLARGGGEAGAEPYSSPDLVVVGGTGQRGLALKQLPRGLCPDHPPRTEATLTSGQVIGSFPKAAPNLLAFLRPHQPPRFFFAIPFCDCLYQVVPWGLWCGWGEP